MPIEVHCNYCGKLVRAPDGAAGRRGECPYCHQQVYIPTPSDQIEPLDVAPLDETAEREQQRLKMETMRFAARVAADRAEGVARNEPTRRPASADRGDDPPPSMVEKTNSKVNLNISVTNMVEEYAVAMAAGDLATAEAYGEEIRRNYNRAEAVIETILNQDPVPDRLKNVPKPVLLAFFKQLRPTR